MTNGEPTDVVRGDRFSGGPARTFLSSLAADERIFEADLAVDRAHVVMLAEQSIIDASEATAILDALDDVEAAGYQALPSGEDVHAAIETAVIERAGPVGGKMHTARSRNDEVAACIRYQLREDLLATATSTLNLREVLVNAATNHVDTVMPGYTHLQPAQPTTIAHWLLSYASALDRDTDRLLDAYARVNHSPLGAAAFAGTPFPIDRDRVATLLGFDGIIRNAMDAAASRDFLVESAGALSALATTLSGLAADSILFANRGFIELTDDYASTSSIMPQKKNPDTLELVRATAGDAAAGFTGTLTTLKGLPRAYNRDLQRATPHVWDAVDAVREAADVSAGAMASAGWNEAALAAAAEEGFATATGVADLLAMAGVPFRQSHEVVATAAASGDTEERYGALDTAAREILGDPLDAIVDPTAVRQALEPLESVSMRDSVGGPAPDAVTADIENARAALEADRGNVETEREALTAATDQLAAEVTTYSQ